MIQQAASLKTDSNSCIGLSHKQIHVTVKERLDAPGRPQPTLVQAAVYSYFSRF